MLPDPRLGATLFIRVEELNRLFKCIQLYRLLGVFLSRRKRVAKPLRALQISLVLRYFIHVLKIRAYLWRELEQSVQLFVRPHCVKICECLQNCIYHLEHPLVVLGVRRLLFLRDHKYHLANRSRRCRLKVRGEDIRKQVL